VHFIDSSQSGLMVYYIRDSNPTSKKSKPFASLLPFPAKFSSSSLREDAPLNRTILKNKFPAPSPVTTSPDISFQLPDDRVLPSNALIPRWSFDPAFPPPFRRIMARLLLHRNSSLKRPFFFIPQFLFTRSFLITQVFSFPLFFSYRKTFPSRDNLHSCKSFFQRWTLVPSFLPPRDEATHPGFYSEVWGYRLPPPKERGESSLSLWS